jgi:hypothetical protein
MSKNFTTIQRIKQLKNVLAILVTILMLSVGKLQAQVTVSPGVGGPYATVNAAFAAINAGTHTGAVTVAISANTTEPAAPTVLEASGVGAANYTSVTIYPTVAGVVVAGTSSASRGVLEFNGVDNLTINGNLNNGAGTSRDLTIQNNTANTNVHAVLWFKGTATAPALGNTNIIVKNTKLIANANVSLTRTTTTPFQPAVAFSSATFPTSTTTATSLNNSNVTFDNNEVLRCFGGLHFGQSTTAAFTGLTVTNNTIGSTTLADYAIFRAIYVANNTGALIQGNTLLNIRSTISSSCGAIELSGATGSGNTVSKNRISGVSNTSSGGWGSAGIYVISGNNNTVIDNNLIYDLQGANYSSVTTTFNTYGIRLASGTGHKVYYNSVNLYGTINSGTSPSASTAIAIGATAVTGLDIRNNIFSNLQVSTVAGFQAFCMRYASGYSFATAGNTVNNNYYGTPSTNTATTSYFVGGTFGAGITYATLAAMQTATGYDANSLPSSNAPAPFTADNNLVIPNAISTPIESAGVPIAGFTTDYLGITRPGGTGTAPDMGAYEFDGALNCTSPPTPGASSTTSSTVCNGSSATLNLVGNSSGPTQTYQWQSCPTIAGTYSNVGSLQFSPSLLITPSSTLYYQCAVTCSGNTQYSTPVLVTVNNMLAGGTYTINSALATGGANFQSFNDVKNALACGITGPVVFNVDVASGPYTEQVEFGVISGASAVNTITINGNGRTLTYNATVSSAPGTLVLNGTDYMTVNNLVVNGTGGTYALVCHLWNQADNNTFNNCTFNAPANGTSTTQVPFSISGSATSGTASGVSGNNNIVDGCTMFSGYYNTCFVGNSSGASTGNQLINSNISDQYFYGSYNLYQNGMIIRGNNFQRLTRTTLSTYYGIYVSTGCTNMLVEKNRIRKTWNAAPTSTGTQYSIYCLIDASVGNENKFYNNLISDINFEGTLYGLYMTGADYWKAYHNTISLDQTASTSTSATYGIYASGTLAYDVQNNIITITRGGTGTKYGVYYLTPAAATSDYNDIYVNSLAGVNNTGYNGTAYTSLSAWQTGSGKDANSISASPVYISTITGNYKPTAVAVDNFGTNLGITDDIMGISRSVTTPDMGAYEFAVSPFDVGVYTLDAPGNSGCYTNSETIQTTIKNLGSAIIDFSTDNVTVTCDIAGPLTTSVSTVISTGTLAPGATLQVNLTPTIDLTANGIYTFDAYTTYALDGNPTNDAITTETRTVGPVAGTVTSSLPSICVSGTPTLTLTGSLYGTIQWQESTVSASGPWTNVGSGATTYTPSLAVTNNTYYQAITSCNANSVTSNVLSLVVNSPTIISTTPGTRCGYGSVALSANSSTGSANWYTAASGGAPVFTGLNFNTPSINTTTTYYAAATSGGSTSNFGLANRVGSTTNSGYSDVGLMFDALTPFTLTSVAVYPVATTPSGNVTATIALKDAAGTILQSTTVSLATSVGPGIKTIVPLNFTVPVGSQHRLVFTSASGGGISGFIRESSTGYTYPYTLAGTASITSAYTSGASAAYYYYFYDWQITTGCESPRQAVVATVTAAPALNLSSTYPAVCGGASTTLNVTSSNDPSYTYNWTSAPSGFTAATAGPHLVTPTATTKYYASAVDNTAGPNAGCTALDSITVTYSASPPVAGTVSASPTEICVSGTSALTVSGSSGGAIQWQSSTVSATGPWTNVGTNSASYSTGTISQTTYYQAITSCSGSTPASNVVTVTVNSPQIVSTTPGSTIGTGTVTLGAVAAGTATPKWYTAPTGGVSVATGNSYVTPVISTTTNYYVSASEGGGGVQYVGKAAPTTALSAVGTYYMNFTVTAPLTIQSVACYFSGTVGTAFVLNIRDAGTLASVFTYSGNTTINGTTTPQILPLNAVLSPGSYQMGWTTDPGTHRESTGSSYPYTLPGIISITGNTFNDPNYWYYFYNWAIETGCESARQAVTATVLPAPLDASIASVTPVNPANAGANTVSVNITNNSASTTINSLVLAYTDGGTPHSESFNSLNIAPGATQLITFATPYNAVYSFNFRSYITSVNGTLDYTQLNDTTALQSLCVALNGTYTINSALPTAGSNYNNLADVAVALACGVTGPVVFNMYSSFTEQVTITPIPGASATNTITFNGNGITLSYNATVSSAPHTLALNGADYLRFNDMTIEGTGATYALVCHLWNNADNNRFTNCTFNAPANGTATTQVPFSISGTAISGTATGPSGNNNVITGCTMFSGYYNTTLVGASATPNTGNQVINCNIRDQYFYGMYNLYQNGAILRGNTVERPSRTTLSTFYGIYVSTSCTNMLVEKNRVRNPFATNTASTSTAYGIYNVSAGTAGNENRVYNNLVYDMNSAGIVYGIYANSYNKIYHNTVSLDHTGSTATGSTYSIYCTGGVTTDIRNNIVSLTRGGTGTKYCLYYSSLPATSNNNVLYLNAAAGTNNIGYNGTAYTTLSAWQIANPLFDGASVTLDPLFASPATGDFSPSEPALNGIGANVGIVEDINGSPRTFSPDPGAFEFGVAVAPPSCATVTLSNQTCLSATKLSWPVASGFPTGYYFSYGTTPAANDLVSQQDLLNVRNVTFPTLSASTTYYYKIEPYNALGTAASCSVASFLSGSNVTQTPTQSSSSYTETMDNGVTPPDLPCGVTSSNENFPADAFTWYTALGAANAHAGTRYLRIDKNTNNTTPKDDWIYSAPMNLTGGKLYRIYFWHRVGTSGSENFEVFLSNSNDAATMLTTSAVFNGTSNLLTYKLDSSADIIPPFSGIYYYGIHANGAANGRSLYMDDIQVKQVPVAAMDPASCITVPSLYDQLLVQPVYQAQDYKFKIENLATSFSYEYTRNLPIPDFRLKWAPGVTYDLSYDVSVSYKKNNVWSPYGPSCVVTMGPFPTTQLRGASCGATLTDLYTPLYIDSVGGANDYEYRIVQNTLAYDHTWMRGAPVLDYRLYWAYQTSPLLVERVQFGFTYDVQVRALVGRTGPAQGSLPGTLGTFGPVCTVTLSGQPQTQLVAAPGPQQSCGKTLTNITDQIFCIPVVGASNYRYTAVNAALGYNATADRNSTLNDFRLNWLPTVSGVGLRYATTYDITVQNNVGGVWSTAGTMCQVTTPAQPLTQLQPAYCLYTLPTFSTPIYCNAVPAATNYRYRITDVATSGATYTKIIDRNAPSTDFRFTWTLVCCGGLNVLPNTPYNVEVASYAGGVWSAYGTVCTVTTSATVPRYNPFLAEDGKVEVAAAEVGLSVYPNPSAVNETYYVELNGIQKANEKVAINIYNVLGAKVYSTQVITKEESRVVLQPEQTLAAGVYTVEAQINGTVSRVKFVVK